MLKYLKILAAFVILGILVAAVKVKAADNNFFAYTSLGFGLEHNKHQAPECQYNGMSRNLTRSTYFKQGIYLDSNENFDIYAKYTNSVCFMNDTAKRIESFQLNAEWKLWW